MFILRRSQQKLKVPSIWFFIFGFYIIILMNHSILTCAKPIDTAKYLPLIKEHASPNTLAAIAEAEVQESAKHYTHKKPKYHKMYPESPQAVPHSLKQIAGHYSNIYQPPFPYKKVRHHHYHPIVLYKKKKIPGKYWHEAQRRLVTKHGGLDILGDIVQLPNGRVLDGNLGQNVPNFNDGYFKPWELRARLMKQQRELVKSLIKALIRLARDPPATGSFIVKEIDMLD
ncbi:hypothetical protein DERF_001971 [Dermatophagoides farinae]|uniref:Uncharacterized protein n=1 Tax=Dermatophagoides farinae TaxID=6954 RepID=A0A922LA63_DERFA|nr:hypothetical protein DERF_001971 [Dermatophagoides farinae]